MLLKKQMKGYDETETRSSDEELHQMHGDMRGGKMEYIFTERAHLMCPAMCFGMVISMDREFNKSRIMDTAEELAGAHPFLRALISYDEKDDRYFYDIGNSSKTDITVFSNEISGIEDPEIMHQYESITGKDFDLYREGLLKAAAWPEGGKTVVLLVFHHLLADGRGALNLSKEFADCYVFGIKPAFAEEKLISSVSEFPADSGLPSVSRLLVKRANRQWKREDRRLSYEEYHRLAGEFLTSDQVNHKLSAVPERELYEILKKCRAEGVTVNDYLLAKVFLEEDTRRIVIARDLRSCLKCYRRGAMGNYSTAFSVELRKNGNDLFETARKVHAAMRKISAKPWALYLVLQCYAALEPGLLDAAMMSAKGKYESRAAGFIGRMFFHLDRPEGYSVTNLGKTESAAIEDAFFIPPASPAMRKTLGVLTVNGRMRICTSERED